MCQNPGRFKSCSRLAEKPWGWVFRSSMPIMVLVQWRKWAWTQQLRNRCGERNDAHSQNSGIEVGEETQWPEGRDPRDTEGQRGRC